MRLSRAASPLLLAALLLSRAAPSATYHVAPGGDDAGPGTLASPWKTIGKAAATLGPGDTVLIRAGTYFEHVVPQTSGAAGAEIVYAAYPGETATIDGTGVDIPEWAGLFNMEGRSYLRVSGLRVVNARTNVHNPGILADTCDHIVIQGNTVVDTNDSGIAAWNSSWVTIADNEVERACLGGYNESLTVGNTTDFEVRGNLVHHSTKEGICLKDGSARGRAFGNEVHHTDAVGFYVDAQAQSTHDIDVYGNLSHDGVEDGFAVASEVAGLLENVRLFNNVAFSNGWNGFLVSDCCVASHPIVNVLFANNTAYDNGRSGWGGGLNVQNPQALGVVLRNNVASANLTFQIVIPAGSTPEKVVVDHNLIHLFRGDTEEVRGDAYVEGDPLFVNAAGADFHLQAGSPAIDAGSAVSAPATDFDGVARPQGAGFDIGAFERASPPAAFYTLAPCRLVDTRLADGPLGGPALVPGAARGFAAAGACGVPPAARALSLNVTVTEPTGAGYLTLYPGGGSPPFVSSINFLAGQTRANNAVVPVAATVAFGVLNGSPGSVHLVLDVNGYFQ